MPLSLFWAATASASAMLDAVKYRVHVACIACDRKAASGTIVKAVMVAIVQGDIDEVVPFEHGKALHKAAKNPYPPLWASGYGHQNLEFCSSYLPILQEYLNSLFGPRQ